MNRKQWLVLAFGILLINILFIKLDYISPLSCDTKGEPLNTADVWCIVNAEIFDPFIWLTGFLWIIFLIIGLLEPKK